MADKIYVYYNTPEVVQYIRVFKGLLKNAKKLGIDLTAAFLYSVLYSRANLSYKNGWFNSHGHIYVMYTREEFARDIGCSKQTARKAFQSLAAAGLTEEIARTNRKGGTLSPHIYVRQWNVPSGELTIEKIVGGALPYLNAHNIGVIPDTYMKLPVELISLDEYRSLSIRAKLLYAHIFEMTQLSLNYGWIDSNRRYWCEVDAKEVEELLGCGHDSLSKSYRELIGAGLVSRIRAEYGCAVHTYLHPVWINRSAQSESTEVEEEYDSSDESVLDNFTPSDLEVWGQYTDNIIPSHPEIFPLKSEKLPRNNLTEISSSINPQKASISSFEQDVAAMRDRYYAMVDGCMIITAVPLLLGKAGYARGNIGEILALAISVMARDAVSACRKLCVGKELVDKRDVIAAYERIDRDIMITLLTKIVPVWGSIEAPVSYLQAALFRAFEDHGDEAYYTHCKLASLGIT